MNATKFKVGDIILRKSKISNHMYINKIEWIGKSTYGFIEIYSNRNGKFNRTFDPKLRYPADFHELDRESELLPDELKAELL